LFDTPCGIGALIDTALTPARHQAGKPGLDRVRDSDFPGSRTTW
jgi:hypothetical protein